MLQQQINLTFGRKKAPPVLKTVQNDTGRQLFAIPADMTIPSGAGALLTVRTPDGMLAASIGTVTGQAVAADITDTMLATPGVGTGQLSITGGGETVKSQSFPVLIEEEKG